MSRNFNQLKSKLYEIDTRFSETNTLAEKNINRLKLLEEKSKITNSKLEEHSKKIEQLEELE